MKPALLLLFLFAAGATAQPERTISVDGEAEVQVTPDHVIVSLGVETQGKTIDAAVAGNAEVIKRLVDVARKHGVTDQDLKTDFIQFHVQHAQGAAIPIEFYVARKSLVVTLRELGRFESFLTAALNAGATHLHGVDFRTSELRKYRDQARELAVKAAAEKAADMARALGRRVNARPVDINALQTDSRSWYGSGWGPGPQRATAFQNVSLVANAAGTPALDGSVAFGRISVTARVAARFVIE